MPAKRTPLAIETDDGPLGVVYDVPIETYHADTKSISNTGLLDLARSPLHYHALHVNPTRPPPATKPGQLEGTLMHVAALEPHTFDQRFAIGPSVSRNTKRWHEFIDDENKRAVMLACAPRTCIQAEQWEVAQAQAMSLRALSELGPLLTRGVAESSAYWIDPTTGVRCRCRPDYAHRTANRGKARILVDLKTCGDASPEEFVRQIARKTYHVQAAFYSDGYEAASGSLTMGFVFGAVEDKWPFAACAAMLDDDSLELGRREVRRLLVRYAHCVAAGSWPSYSETIQLVRLPTWRLQKESA